MQRIPNATRRLISACRSTTVDCFNVRTVIAPCQQQQHRGISTVSAASPRVITSSKYQQTNPADIGFCCSYHRADYIKRQRQVVATQADSASFSTSASAQPLSDPVFAIDTNTIRYGRGALEEVGPACQSLGLKRVMVVTDKNIIKLAAYQRAVRSVRELGIDVVEYDQVSVEPTLRSLMHATDFAKQAKVDGFISLGGGSAIDTAKAANLYSTHPPPDNDPLAYVNVPVGRGLFPKSPIKPHIACPFTAGTGSESTGISIFDHEDLGVKTGIAHKGLRPTMAIIDPSTQETIPKTVCAASGFDVLSHALESYTAISHTQRATTARTPLERFQMRPMSQGSNPWADHGCLSALSLLGSSILAAHRGDTAARDNMMLASTMAAIAFGNVGVHLPHAFSYSVAGMVKGFKAKDYDISEGDIVPHGMAVVLNAPAVFRKTAHSSPKRHYEAAKALGAQGIEQVDQNDPKAVGECLSKHLIYLMKATEMPNGLQAVGYEELHVEGLMQGAKKQQRLLNNLPMKLDDNDLKNIVRDAMKYW